MNIEIERKYLVNADAFTPTSKGICIKQGYLSREGCTLRVRIADDKAFLTIKTKTVGISRQEFEYEIPLADGLALLQLSLSPAIEKTRYVEIYDGKTWEIDVFEGANAGLVMAEIELQSEDETHTLPPFISHEVSNDKRYFNSYLSKHPYTQW